MPSLRLVALASSLLFVTSWQYFCVAEAAGEGPTAAAPDTKLLPSAKRDQNELPTPPRRVGKLGSATDVDDATWQVMQGKSWHPNIGCPARDKLALLKSPFIDFFDQEQLGEMIVAKGVSVEVLQIFAELYRIRFPIASMRLIDTFAGRDVASMAANNSTAFNCRAITGGSRLSEHSFGTAIDLNPVQNPYVTGLRVMPIAGQQFGTLKARLEPRPMPIPLSPG